MNPAPASSIERPERPYRRFAVLLVLGGCLTLTLVWSLGVRPPAWYPPCPVHAATGLHCPGCGAARAVHALMHGEFLAALHDNALLMLVFPLLFAWSLVVVWRALRQNLPPLDMPTGTARIMMIATIVFVLARNLPWWPCTVLAPLP